MARPPSATRGAILRCPASVVSLGIKRASGRLRAVGPSCVCVNAFCAREPLSLACSPGRWRPGPLHAHVNPRGGGLGRLPTMPPIGFSCALTGYCACSGVRVRAARRDWHRIRHSADPFSQNGLFLAVFSQWVCSLASTPPHITASPPKPRPHHPEPRPHQPKPRPHHPEPRPSRFEWWLQRFLVGGFAALEASPRRVAGVSCLYWCNSPRLLAARSRFGTVRRLHRRPPRRKTLTMGGVGEVACDTGTTMPGLVRRSHTNPLLRALTSSIAHQPAMWSVGGAARARMSRLTRQ